MLKDAQSQLREAVNPLLGQARSLEEGQDLKGAYSIYSEIAKIDPSHEEALNKMSEIRDTLYNRSRKLYRDALVSESLSLFEEAKEKFQEVKQISPEDSEYYNKAALKLKSYLE